MEIKYGIADDRVIFSLDFCGIPMPVFDIEWGGDNVDYTYEYSYTKFVPKDRQRRAEINVTSVHGIDGFFTAEYNPKTKKWREKNEK